MSSLVDDVDAQTLDEQPELPRRKLSRLKKVQAMLDCALEHHRRSPRSQLCQHQPVHATLMFITLQVGARKDIVAQSAPIQNKQLDDDAAEQVWARQCNVGTQIVSTKL